MELTNEPGPQDLTNDGNDRGTILSEASLRTLSKSLTVAIPKNAAELDQAGLG